MHPGTRVQLYRYPGYPCQVQMHKSDQNALIPFATPSARASKQDSPRTAARSTLVFSACKFRALSLSFDWSSLRALSRSSGCVRVSSLELGLLRLAAGTARVCDLPHPSEQLVTAGRLQVGTATEAPPGPFSSFLFPFLQLEQTQHEFSQPSWIGRPAAANLARSGPPRLASSHLRIDLKKDPQERHFACGAPALDGSPPSGWSAITSLRVGKLDGYPGRTYGLWTYPNCTALVQKLKSGKVVAGLW